MQTNLKMLFSVLSMLCLGVGIVLAQNMPEIVARLQETRGLWRSLHGPQHLPGAFTSSDLRGISTATWHSFLRSKGERLIREKWLQVPTSQRGGGKNIEKMIRFANDPSSMRELLIVQPGSKRVASDLIVEYAKFLQGNDHIHAVNSHLQLPDTADNLLLG